MKSHLHGVEQLPRHQGRPGVLHPYRVGRLVSLGLPAPDCGSGVGFVGQQVVQGVLLPAPSPIGDAPVVQALADFLQAVAPQGGLEYLNHDGSGVQVHVQGGTFLGSVVDLDPLVTEGRTGCQVEAPRRGFPHAPHDLLRQVIGQSINTKKCVILGWRGWKRIDVAQQSGTAAWVRGEA